MQKQSDKRILKGEDFDLMEIRPRRFVKIVDGEITGIASNADLQVFRLQKTIGKVDSGTIQVALALGAISALLTSENNALLVRVIAAGGFVLSSFGAGILYYYHISRRVPWLVTKDWPAIAFIRYFYLLMKFLNAEATWPEENELAYLSFLAAFFLTWIGLFMWVITSFNIPFLTPLLGD